MRGGFFASLPLELFHAELASQSISEESELLEPTMRRLRGYHKLSERYPHATDAFRQEWQRTHDTSFVREDPRM